MTIGQLEALDYTHIECICLTCHSTTQMPFQLIRIMKPDWPISTMTLTELACRMTCGTCRKQDFGFRAWRREDGPGD